MGGELSGRCMGMMSKTKAYIGMVSLQFGYAGMHIITMISLKHGMSNYILALYRYVVATLLIAPFALLLERNRRPKMTFPIFLRIMLLGFLEPVLDQNLYYLGMKYTSATFTSAVFNVLPAITFVMAIIFRLETVNLKKIHSIAKVVGTIITVTGAMVMTFYKGPILDIIGQSQQNRDGTSSSSADQHWVTGTFMLLCSCCGWAAFFILQSFTLKKYPAELSLTAFICLTGMVEGAIVSLVMERDWSAWAVGWDSRLLVVIYSGALCSGLAYYVQSIVIKERGPVFITSFMPLCMIITAALGSIVLAEQVHLGSIIGAIIIVVGLYTVVWGKSKDHLMSTKASLTNEKIDTMHELPITTSNNNTSMKVGGQSEENVGNGISSAVIKHPIL